MVGSTVVPKSNAFENVAQSMWKRLPHYIIYFCPKVVHVSSLFRENGALMVLFTTTNDNTCTAYSRLVLKDARSYNMPILLCYKENRLKHQGNKKRMRTMVECKISACFL